MSCPVHRDHCPAYAIHDTQPCPVALTHTSRPGSHLRHAGHAEYTDLTVAVYTGFSGSEAELGAFGGDRAAALEAQLQPFSGLMDPGAQAAVVNIDDAAAPQVCGRSAAVARLPVGPMEYSAPTHAIQASVPHLRG